MQPLRPLFIGTLCLLIFAVPVTAAQFTVNSTVDQVDATPGDGVCETAPGNGVCTLRAAIQEANALPAPDTITLPVGTYTLTIPRNDSVPDDASGDLAIHDDLTIGGAGAPTTIIQAALDRYPVSTHRVIAVYSLTSNPHHVRISGVTIQNGTSSPDTGGGIFNSATLDLIDAVVTRNRPDDAIGGGGIANVGTLTLTRSVVSDNHTGEGGQGGGILNGGVVTITDSTFSENGASQGGGGMANSGGNVTITNSTFSSNSGSGILNQRGGVATVTNSTLSRNGNSGIENNGSALTITNSTLSGNDGHGILNQSDGVLTVTNSTLSGNGIGIGNNNGSVLTITNSTISGNNTDPQLGHLGGGLFNVGVVNMKNTILAVNLGPDCFAGSTKINSLGHNVVGDDSCTITPGTGDQIGSAGSPIDPLLGTLADNGGPTLTHALLAGSPAIDAGDNLGCPPTDQRGVLRPQGTACDIGAFELIPLVATFATSAGQFSNLTAVPESILPATGKPAGLTFPFGFFSWTVTELLPGQTINVTITHPTALPVGAQYWKVTGGTWTDVTSLLGTSNADGDTVLTLTITDGGFGDGDAQANGQISDPGGVGLAPTSTVHFAVFIPEVEIKLPRGANNDTFEVEAFFTLGAGSDGIFPLTEDLTLDVGPYSATIPAGSFKEKKGRFKFKGVIDGVRLAATIRPRARGGFKFEAEGKCADLDGTVNRVTVGLTIGDDRGSAAVTAEIESSRKGGKCGDRRDDDKDDKHDKDDDDD